MNTKWRCQACMKCGAVTDWASSPEAYLAVIIEAHSKKSPDCSEPRFYLELVSPVDRE